MKSVFRISRKDKVKPIDLSTLQAPEDIDSKLALIQALVQRCQWPKSKNVVSYLKIISFYFYSFLYSNRCLV
ncbi:MAG: hypothetical protein ABSB32_18770 [Thermodesulfobacteriota bacterium]